MRMCRVALACTLTMSIAGDARAFGFDIHVEITRAALAAVLDNLARQSPVVRQAVATDGLVRISTFSLLAIQEIADANKAMDTDDCGGKGNPRVPANPCTVFLSESLAALKYLEKEPAHEHVDSEKIQMSSDLVLASRKEIRDFLRDGNFVGARKALGRALHVIQDFYSHTNYVDLGYRSPNIETRFGASANSFSRGLRVAAEDEPTCLEGEYLFTNALKARLTALLITTREEIRTSLLPISRVGAMTKAMRIEAALKALEPVLKDPALTSGYFVGVFPVVSVFGVAVANDDPAQITVTGKCRHGAQSYGNVLGVDAGIGDQSGIHKDFPNRPGHLEARQLAVLHSMQFVVDVMKDEELRRNVPNYGAYLLGFLGYPVYRGLTVGVPGAPNNESWDTAIGSALLFFVQGARGLKNIQPDVSVCLLPDNRPGTCAPVCDDADWNNDTDPPAYLCSQAMSVPASPLRVLVREMDFGEPRRVIADFRVEDPTKCSDSYESPTGSNASARVSGAALPVATPGKGKCVLDLEPGRTVWVQFRMASEPSPAPAQAPVPPATTQSPIPPPFSPPLPPRTPDLTGPPAPPEQPGLPATMEPTLPAGPGLSGPLPGSLPPTPTAPPTTSAPTAVPGTGSGVVPPPRPPTFDEIDRALGLRDLDNCVGSDLFFPSSASLVASPLGQRLGPGETSRLYQAAAVVTAIADPAAKKNLMGAVQSRVDGGDWLDVMTALLTNPQLGQAVLVAYQETAKNIAGRITATRLDRLLQPPRAPAAIEPEVSRWIVKRLATASLASEAADWILTGPGISAECTINELAKGGFTDVVNGL